MPESKPSISAIVPWFGSKRSMAARIARECCQPDGRAPKSFWELCGGSMAVSLEMPRCSHHHVVDLHGDLLNVARIIQDPQLGPVFYRRLRRLLSHETLFRDAKAALETDDNQKLATFNLFAPIARVTELDPLSRAVAFSVPALPRNDEVAGTERVNYQPAIRWTSGGGHGGIRFASAVRSIPAWRRRMRDWTILQRDVFEVLAKIEDQAGTVIYIDPPYVRDGERRSGSCTYLHEFKRADHERLATSLRRFKSVRVVVSYYDVPYVRELYAGWSVVECMTQKNLHVQNKRGVGRCEAPEVLIINGESHTAAAGSEAA